MTAPVLQDRIAEVATLAAAMESPAARKEAKHRIIGADFYQPAHETLWDAMAALDRAGKPVDATSVRMEVANNQVACTALLEVMTAHYAMPDSISTYAESVRTWSVRRRLAAEAARTMRAAEDPEVDGSGLASVVASKFAAIRDDGSEQDIQSITLTELLAEPDDEMDWVIPNLLEKRDRFILTGAEGLGKSYLLRQIAIMGAAGLHPFDMNVHIRPLSVLIVDCENSLRQIKKKSRGVVEFADHYGRGTGGNVNLLAVGRIDILRDKDLATIHREVDGIRPDLIVIGPIYAMSPKALMTDDDAVPVLAALDGLREHGASLLMEAHAGHAVGQDGRNFRPRGSAALMGWPEFGYGLKSAGATGYADLVPWRGDRDSREWPQSLRHDSSGTRWIVHDGRGVEPERRATWTPTSGINGGAA